jgi:hypothetical protein
MKYTKSRLLKHLERNVSLLSQSNCPHKTTAGKVSPITWNCSGRGINAGLAESAEQAISTHLDCCIEVYGKGFK